MEFKNNPEFEQQLAVLGGYGVIHPLKAHVGQLVGHAQRRARYLYRRMPLRKAHFLQGQETCPHGTA